VTSQLHREPSVDKISLNTELYGQGGLHNSTLHPNLADAACINGIC
jgi:hypothetical protein